MPPFVHVDPRGWLAMKLAGAGAVVALADWLFFGEGVGVSLPLFLALLAALAAMGNRIRADSSGRTLAVAALALALLPSIEAVGVLSFCFGVFGTACFAILLTAAPEVPFSGRVKRSLVLPFCGVPWLIGDALRIARLVGRRQRPLFRLDWLMIGLVPTGLFAAFVVLFSEANPLIENMLAAIDLTPLLELLQPVRCIFWAAILCAAWPLIHLRRQRRRIVPSPTPARETGRGPAPSILLGERSIVISLISCNALFAVQNLLDGAYLWGGLRLPHGMSYSTYAHRGAYPLIVTALLSAAFVLVAMRRGGPARSSSLIRPLVIAWTVQNMWLVISSILRLDLYVETYSLTGLRVSAFIWMILVLVGLALILVQIAQDRSNRWLLGANAVSLVAILYASCFVDFPYLIAAYNIDHSFEVHGTGARLDLRYLASLGPEVIPALDRLPVTLLASGLSTCELQGLLGAANAERRADWRAWSFRQWRLGRYLSSTAGAVKASIRQARQEAGTG
jgi:hypothetical protein